MTYTPRSNFGKDIAGFFEFRQSQGRTLDNAVRYLYRFDQFCAEKRPDAELLTKDLIQEWLKDAISQGYIDMVGRCSAIRIFAKYLRGIGKEAYALPGSYARDKRTFVPYVFNKIELASFFKTADNLKEWHCGDRFAPVVAPVLFRLMYTCGLRPSEVRGIKNADVNLHTGEIYIRSNKTKKERIIVVSDDMLRFLREYENSKSQFFARTEYYLSRADGLQYTSQQLGTLFDKCWVYSNPGVERDTLPPARPYDLRHSYASTILQIWLNEGKDLYSVLPYLRAYMGHEHFADTAYYIHILPERLLESTGVDWDKLDSTIPEVRIWD
jgi:integrase